MVRAWKNNRLGPSQKSQKKGVEFIGGVSYKVDDSGLHIQVDGKVRF